MPVDHVDVLIVGAGLSGIGAACHLRKESPGKTFAILESRDAIGGTWDLFRYPGIRSDSDMFTLGYIFRPWTAGKAIADGPSIRSYVRDTAREYDVESSIRFQHRVVRAEWSTQDARWLVEAHRTDTAETVQLTCGFLFVCSGYYNYEQGYTPDFPGIESYAGQVIHPQLWPENLDYAGKRVVVIGSGATAVTLVPAMTDEAEHVTMLQRSPSYLVSQPSEDPWAKVMRGKVPNNVAYSILRWKHVLLATASFQLSRHAPKVMKGILRKGLRKQLPETFDVNTHFRPRYNPWDQRLCVVPDGNFFKAIRDDKVAIATDTIETFTEKGIKLSSGEELNADIIVTATGLNLLGIGGMSLVVDGSDVELGDTVAYKGMMLSGVPNFALTVGYTNASWTLKADLVASYVCRLLNHMDARGTQICTPIAPQTSGQTRPLIDLMSGYVLRSAENLPKQGERAPWRLYQNYVRDLIMLRRGRLTDNGIRFTRRPLMRTAAVTTKV
jgi:cation diffusion facilitator CzcD-associated flavoprotein CzcO